MTTRDRRLIIIAGVLAAIAAAWFLVIGPKRSEASKLASQISQTQAQLNDARSQVVQAESSRKSFAGDYAEIVRLGEAVPPDDDVPSLLVQLQRAASAAGVDFRTLTLVPSSSSSTPTATPTPSPSPATTTAPAGSSSSSSTSAPTATSASTSTSASSSTSSTSSPAASSTAAAALTPVAASAAALPPGAAVGPAGFPTEQFTLSFQGSFFHLSNFFRRLESFVTLTNKQVQVSGRLMTLNAINLGAGANGFPQMVATVSATTYLVPAAQGLLNGASASGPAAPPSTSQPVSGVASTSSAPPTAAVMTPSAP
jgi:hypothetical protein